MEGTAVKCPQCEEELDDYQIDDGICVHCGATIDPDELGDDEEIYDDDFETMSHNDED